MQHRTGRRAITGATVIDGNGGKPIEKGVILIEGSRISAVGGRDLPVPPDTQQMEASGKFVIPGLMNANVHLFGAVMLQYLARYWGQYEAIIEESAQIALKSGLTSVFDTWGPRRFLMKVRDRINAGEVQGSRIFCAGNIAGFDGPFSADFDEKSVPIASPDFARRINAIWVENVGRHLMWLEPPQLAAQIATYIERGIDFVKYASNEHGGQTFGAMLQFSPQQQAAIVGEAHRHGITAQAHTMSIEGLRLAIEAGCDLITHCNLTGPVPIPESTLELFTQRNTGAVVFALTEAGFNWAANSKDEWTRTLYGGAGDINTRNLIRTGAQLLLANDGVIFPREIYNDPRSADDREWVTAEKGGALFNLPDGHFGWFRAMEEKGCQPMRMLQAATRNIAIAYGKQQDLGTLEAGKFADMLILDKNPLEAAANYRTIHAVIKEGVVIDRDCLPLKPVLTASEPPAEEESAYRPFPGTSLESLESTVRGATAPLCPACMCLRR